MSGAALLGHLRARHVFDLKRVAGDRYRVTLDESAEHDPLKDERPWLYRIPGARSHNYVHGPETLGVSADRRSAYRKLEAIPGARVHQRGDSEVTVLFPLISLTWRPTSSRPGS